MEKNFLYWQRFELAPTWIYMHEGSTYTRKHTCIPYIHIHTIYTFQWGSLRLAPINTYIKYNDLIKVLSEHYDSAPSYRDSSSTIELYRTEEETIVNFVASLRVTARYCDYEDTLNM